LKIQVGLVLSRKAAELLLLFLIASTTVSATLIVAVKSKTTVILAADGLGIENDGRGREATQGYMQDHSQWTVPCSAEGKENRKKTGEENRDSLICAIFISS